MTKAQLINALIDQEDLKDVLEKLVWMVKNPKGSTKYFSKSRELYIDFAEDIIKELESDDQLVYFREPYDEPEDLPIEGVTWGPISSDDEEEGIDHAILHS